jgi:hypothetical protein
MKMNVWNVSWDDVVDEMGQKLAILGRIRLKIRLKIEKLIVIFFL